MDKKYEISLSYANSNDELSLADPFGPTLRSIFQNSQFSLVLYTKEYKRGQFAPVELREIIKKAEEEQANNFFLIKADDSPIEETQLQDAYYISLNPSHFKTKEEVQKKVEEIVRKNIKTCMIKRTIQDNIDGRNIFRLGFYHDLKNIFNLFVALTQRPRKSRKRVCDMSKSGSFDSILNGNTIYEQDMKR